MSYINQQRCAPPQAQPHQAELPEGWEMMIDQRTGYPFYVDHINKITSWTAPTQQTRTAVPSPYMQQPQYQQKIPVQHGQQQFGAPQGHGQGPRPDQQHYSTSQSHSQGSHNINNQTSNSAYGQGVEIPIQRVHSQQPPQPAKSGNGFQGQNFLSGPKMYAGKSELPAHVQQPERPKSAEPSNLPNPNQSKRSGSEPRSFGDEPLDKISTILSEVEQMDKDINAFNGTENDKQYKILEEMLTRSLIKLDDIESHGREDIRNGRKHVVKRIQATLDLLELKAMACSTDVPAQGQASSEYQNYPTNVSNQKISAASKTVTDAMQSSGENTTRRILSEKISSEKVAASQRAPSSQDSSLFSGNPAPVKDLVLDSEVQC